MTEHDPVKEYARMAAIKKREDALFRLEVAAPGLLEACKAALTLHLWEAGAHNQTIIWQIEAAIAKAEGEK